MTLDIKQLNSIQKPIFQASQMSVQVLHNSPLTEYSHTYLCSIQFKVYAQHNFQYSNRLHSLPLGVPYN